MKESHQPDPGFNFEDVTKGGNTLLWDLVQEENAVSLYYKHILKIFLILLETFY